MGLACGLPSWADVASPGPLGARAKSAQFVGGRCGSPRVWAGRTRRCRLAVFPRAAPRVRGRGPMHTFAYAGSRQSAPPTRECSGEDRRGLSAKDVRPGSVCARAHEQAARRREGELTTSATLVTASNRYFRQGVSKAIWVPSIATCCPRFAPRSALVPTLATRSSASAAARSPATPRTPRTWAALDHLRLRGENTPTP